MYEIWRLYIENYSNYCVTPKVLTKFRCDLDIGLFDPKMYKYLLLTILHLLMKYQSCTLKTTQVIVSEPKCWQSSVVSDLWTPKCIGIFLSPSCIYVWNMKVVCWNCDLDLLTPQCIGIFLSPSCIYIWNLYIENYSSYRVRTKELTKFSCDWPLTSKCIGSFLSPSCI